MNKWKINLFGLNVPFWGFKDTNYQSFVVDEESYTYDLFGLCRV